MACVWIDDIHRYRRRWLVFLEQSNQLSAFQIVLHDKIRNACNAEPSTCSRQADVRITKMETAVHAHIQLLGTSAEGPSIRISHIQIDNGFMVAQIIRNLRCASPGQILWSGNRGGLNARKLA